jgi:hypothetical protein
MKSGSIGITTTSEGLSVTTANSCDLVFKLCGVSVTAHIQPPNFYGEDDSFLRCKIKIGLQTAIQITATLRWIFASSSNGKSSRTRQKTNPIKAHGPHLFQGSPRPQTSKPPLCERVTELLQEAPDLKAQGPRSFSLTHPLPKLHQQQDEFPPHFNRSSFLCPERSHRYAHRRYPLPSCPTWPWRSLLSLRQRQRFSLEVHRHLRDSRIL